MYVRWPPIGPHGERGPPSASSCAKHLSLDAVGGRLGVRCQGLWTQGYMPKVVHLLLIDDQQLW